MTWPFLILAALTVFAAIAAMSLRNLVHCALCLALTFLGLAGLFLQLDAQFVGLVQILVYVGAVAILIVFAILLTRQGDPARPAPITTGTGWGIAIATVAFLAIGGAIRKSQGSWRVPPPPPAVTVRSVGDQLMQNYVVPLEVIGLLLTAALIGAVIIAMQDHRPPAEPGCGGPAPGAGGGNLPPSAS